MEIERYHQRSSLIFTPECPLPAQHTYLYGRMIPTCRSVGYPHERFPQPMKWYTEWNRACPLLIKDFLTITFLVSTIQIGRKNHNSRGESR